MMNILMNLLYRQKSLGEEEVAIVATLNVARIHFPKKVAGNKFRDEQFWMEAIWTQNFSFFSLLAKVS